MYTYITTWQGTKHGYKRSCNGLACQK